PWQCWTPGGLREVGVRVRMRYHNVKGIASRRQASDVNPDHIDGEVGSESPANDLAGCGLGTRPDLFQELDEATGSKLGCGQVDRCIGIDVIRLVVVNHQVVERRSCGGEGLSDIR